MGLLLHSLMLAVTTLAVSWCFLGSDGTGLPRFPSWAPWERAGQTHVMFVCSPASTLLGFGVCLAPAWHHCHQPDVLSGKWEGRVK